MQAYLVYMNLRSDTIELSYKCGPKGLKERSVNQINKVKLTRKKGEKNKTIKGTARSLANYQKVFVITYILSITRETLFVLQNIFSFSFEGFISLIGTWLEYYYYYYSYYYYYYYYYY
jgi:hypothetical protein